MSILALFVVFAVFTANCTGQRLRSGLYAATSPCITIRNLFIGATCEQSAPSVPAGGGDVHDGQLPIHVGRKLQAAPGFGSTDADEDADDHTPFKSPAPKTKVSGRKERNTRRHALQGTGKERRSAESSGDKPEEADPTDSNYSDEESEESSYFQGQRRSPSVSRRVCNMKITVDHTLFEFTFNMTGSKPETRAWILSAISRLVEKANEIYGRTNFGGVEDMRFLVQHIVVSNAPFCTQIEELDVCVGSNRDSNKYCSSALDAPYVLYLLSLERHDDFCLSYRLNYRDFQDGTLGLAWIAMADELCSKWQRNISRQNLVINDKSPSTVVCSRHFRQIYYAPDCRIRKLLPGAVPTVFEDYPAYLAPSAKKPREEPVVRQSLPPRKPTKRKAEPEELPADLDAPESFDKPSANVSTQTTNNYAQRASRYLSMVGRLRSQVAYHRSQSQKSLSLLRAEQKASEAYRANRHLAALEEIVADAERGEKKAVFLLHQIGRYGKKHDSYPEEFIRECVIWRFISPKGYDYARTSGLLTLPTKCTLQRYMGPSPTTSGMSAAMKERLVSEASMLSSKQHMASLIIDEASIRPKCIYDRKADAVFGLKDKPGGDTPSSSKEIIPDAFSSACVFKDFLTNALQVLSRNL
ncbi:hypothetical protein HPB48_026360 [Haemaphysalis longicornis]|uniref:THAP-type domain-containing protein n=1 Tax=Haemaphysalis longicornis TaxID=44386 RepID=A0A9J6HBN9_HAELO|nr:hypothetical protein HPB48_026360 [Haemaphysalis longicornis]